MISSTATIQALPARWARVALATLVTTVGLAVAGEVRSEPSEDEPQDETDGEVVDPDCERHELDDSTAVALCGHDPEDSNEHGRYEIIVYEGEEPIHQYSRKLASVRFPPEPLTVLDSNDRWVGYTQDQHECTRLWVVDLKHERLALDTGCWQTGYYGVEALPAPDECEIVLTNGGGDDNPEIQPPYELDLCSPPFDLTREALGED